MSSYIDGTARDFDGIAVPGALVYVYSRAGVLATLVDAFGQPLANPLVSDALGYWKTFVADGYYTVSTHWAGRERRVEANILAGDPPLGPNSDPNVRADLFANSGSTLIGDNDGAGGSLWSTVRGFISYLRSSVGSSIMGFIQSGAGATARTAQAKMRDVVSVRDFGAVGDINGPFPDDTEAIQKAITATGLYSAGLGRTSFIPFGLYRLSASLVPENGSRFYGDGSRQSMLYNEQDPIPTVPAFAAAGSLGFSTFEDFGMRSQKSGFDIGGATDQLDFVNLHIYGMADAALRFRGFLQTTVIDRVEIEACESGVVSETSICNLVTLRDVAFKSMVGPSLTIAGSQSLRIEGARFEGAGDAAKTVIELDGSQQITFSGGYAEACHKTFLHWTNPSGVVVFENFHWTYFTAGVPFLWNVAAGAQLVFVNCESTAAMEVPPGSVLIGRNTNIFCSEPTIASASVVTLPPASPLVTITGTTTIDALTGGNVYLGIKVTLFFAAAATLRDVATGGNCRLAGGANFVASANDTITLGYFSAGWVEVCRSVN